MWWVPERGRAVRMIKDLRVDEPNIVIKPEEHLGLVRVRGAKLPAANVVILTPPGTPSFATRG